MPVTNFPDGIAGPLASAIGAASATAGAATLNALQGKITTETLTTAQNAEYVLTITNPAIAAADMVFATVNNGTNSAGTPCVVRVTPAAGSVVIVVRNIISTATAFNGTLVVGFMTLKVLP
jgi:hypothetical protein